MSDSDSEDLFGSDSGEDTDTLLADANKGKKKVKKLGAARKKSSAAKIPDADNDSDDEDAGLFDSDDEDKEEGKKKATSKSLSKRERMEALRKKKRQAAGLGEDRPRREKAKSDDASSADDKSKKKDEGDAYDSGEEYQRTKEDDDFIDVEGEDEELVKEYYREQHFYDERPDGEDSDEGGRKSKGKKGASKKRSRGPDALDEEDKKDENNPIMAAVNRMKKKKKTVHTFEELKAKAEEFVAKMELAAEEDELAIKEKRPGLKKLQMLDEAVAVMTNREMVRPLLESDVLMAVKRWIQPLPNGSLGNVTVRQKMISVVAAMGTGEDHGIDTDDLKKSGFGKLVMVLYNHKKETPAMKKMHKKLIEEWSRSIFGKSGNMRDLANAQRRRPAGLSAYAARSQAVSEVENESINSKKESANDGDIATIMSKKVKQGRDAGKNRVRIPYSKGFQYTVRPSDIQGDVSDKKTRISSGVADKRESLHKRMLEKNRPVSKNSRSANISIEGRPTK